MNNKEHRDLFDTFFGFMKGIDLRDFIKAYVKVFTYLAVLLMMVAVIVVILISVLHH